MIAPRRIVNRLSAGSRLVHVVGAGFSGWRLVGRESAEAVPDGIVAWLLRDAKIKPLHVPFGDFLPCGRYGREITSEMVLRDAIHIRGAA